MCCTREVRTFQRVHFALSWYHHSWLTTHGWKHSTDAGPCVLGFCVLHQDPDAARNLVCKSRLVMGGGAHYGIAVPPPLPRPDLLEQREPEREGGWGGRDRETERSGSVRVQAPQDENCLSLVPSAGRIAYYSQTYPFSSSSSSSPRASDKRKRSTKKEEEGEVGGGGGGGGSNRWQSKWSLSVPRRVGKLWFISTHPLRNLVSGFQGHTCPDVFPPPALPRFTTLPVGSHGGVGRSRGWRAGEVRGEVGKRLERGTQSWRWKKLDLPEHKCIYCRVKTPLNAKGCFFCPLSPSLCLPLFQIRIYIYTRILRGKIEIYGLTLLSKELLNVLNNCYSIFVQKYELLVSVWTKKHVLFYVAIYSSIIIARSIISPRPDWDVRRENNENCVVHHLTTLDTFCFQCECSRLAQSSPVCVPPSFICPRARQRFPDERSSSGEASHSLLIS